MCPECGKSVDIFKAQAEAREAREAPPEPDRGMPLNTKITFEINPGECLELNIPPEGWKPLAYVLVSGGGLIFILAIIISVWFFMEVALFLQLLPLAMIAGSVYLVLWGLSYAYGTTRIYAEKENFTCTRKVFKLQWITKIPSASINKVKPIPYSTKADTYIPCVIGSSKRIQFGHWLTPEEQGWTCKVIGNFFEFLKMEEEKD
jgi:hypothetical protein